MPVTVGVGEAAGAVVADGPATGPVLLGTAVPGDGAPGEGGAPGETVSAGKAPGDWVPALGGLVVTALVAGLAGGWLGPGEPQAATRPDAATIAAAISAIFRARTEDIDMTCS